MAKIVLGLDIDGVIYDWHSAVYTYFQYEMGYEGTYSDFWSNYFESLSPARIDYILKLPLLCDCIIPSERTLSVLNSMASMAELYYITSRPIELEDITRKFLRKYSFPCEYNLFVTKDKATACRYAGVTHFLDDHVKHVKAVSGIADSYLMAKLWNREYQEELKTVYSLKEFGERIFNT